MINEPIKVTYSSHMGNDMMVVNAARQSFNKQKPADSPITEGDISLINFLASGKTSNDWVAFLSKVKLVAVQDDMEALKTLLMSFKREAQHYAPFAHPQVQMRFTMPVFLARQFVKHQVGGVWSEESRRYIDSEPSFYIQDEYHQKAESVKQGSSNNSLGSTVRDIFLVQTETNREVYKELLDLGTAPEEARQLLTLNHMVNFTWTGSLLFWARVYNQRIDTHAQKAANEVAKLVSSVVYPLFPISWKALTGNEIQET